MTKQPDLIVYSLERMEVLDLIAPEPPLTGVLSLVLETEYSIPDDLKGLRIEADVTLSTAALPNNFKNIHCRLAAFFIIEGMQEFSTEEEVTLPKPFLAHLLGIIISSVRGAILGYSYNLSGPATLLPVLNIADLVPDSLPRRRLEAAE